MGKNVIGYQFPPIGGSTGGTVGVIIKVVKALMGIFKKPSKEAGNTDSNDSLDNIERITQIFSDFKEQVHARAVEIEKAAEIEVDYYAEELQDILLENSEKVMKYGIHTRKLEKQIEKISKRVKGTIDNELSKKVSLDNAECREIIKMIPGSKKEAAMADFLTRTVSGSLDVCCSELHSTLNEIYDDVEIEIIGSVETIQKQIEQLQESFAAIDENNYEETVKKQMADAYYLADVSDIVLELL